MAGRSSGKGRTITAYPFQIRRALGVGKRIHDVEDGPDGSLWMLEDADPGALIHVTPK
jgi:glucose/arabinose dehydrogenase